MSTNKPKISAYVPRHLYDCFKAFCEERGVTMSQGVAVVLAEYFGLEQSVEHEKSTSGLLVERIEALEQKFAELNQSVETRLKALEEKLIYNSSSLSNLPNNTQNSKDGISTLVMPEQFNGSGSTSGLPQESQDFSDSSSMSDVPEQSEIHEQTQQQVPQKTTAELKNNNKVLTNLLGEPLFATPSSAPTQTDDALNTEQEVIKEAVSSDASTASWNNEPLFASTQNQELNIQPISGRKLSQRRFNLGIDTVSGVKRRKTAQEFEDWTKIQDPDGIGWKFVEKPDKGYVPADKLPSELKSRLLEWISQNIIDDSNL